MHPTKRLKHSILITRNSFLQKKLPFDATKCGIAEMLESVLQVTGQACDQQLGCYPKLLSAAESLLLTDFDEWYVTMAATITPSHTANSKLKLGSYWINLNFNIKGWFWGFVFFFFGLTSMHSQNVSLPG